MGEPDMSNSYYPQSGRTHCEVKYLSNNGKEITEIPWVVTSETGTAQTVDTV